MIHFHALYPNADDVLFYCADVFDLADMLGSEIRSTSDYCGDVGFLDNWESKPDDEIRTAYGMLRLADRLDVIARNLDWRHRENAPLFQGEGGRVRLAESMRYVLDSEFPIWEDSGRIRFGWTRCTDTECQPDTED